MKTVIYIVRAENRGEPESMVFGAYPTEELAMARVNFIEQKYGYDYVWFDEIYVGENGGDCELSNR